MSQQPTNNYYISWSSIFDNGKIRYDIKKIKVAVKNVGATNVYVDRQFGWLNQPDVVCFTLPENKKDMIGKELAKVYKSIDYFIITLKNWYTPKEIRNGSNT